MDDRLIAENFLISTYNKSEYFAANPKDKMYRLEHAYRVANIAKEIALKEGIDPTAAQIGGLLHDISYGNLFTKKNAWIEHGRRSAQIIGVLENRLSMSKDLFNQIRYGIAIHVDGVCSYKGEKTPLAMVIYDADVIDRYDAYRIYEGLEFVHFSEMTFETKIEFLNGKIAEVKEILDKGLSSKTANEILAEKIDYQIRFVKRLLSQLNRSRSLE